MTSALTGYEAPAELATVTLFLVPSSVDRIGWSRDVAAPMLSDRARDHALARRGAHPDLIELAPAERKEKIGIDQVRDAIRAAQFSAVQADRKVCTIAEGEKLTVEAANALLKVLEEPPRGLVFALLAEHPGDLLPTIVSRSRVVRVPPRDDRDIIGHLRELGYAAKDAEWLARFVGRPDDVAPFLGKLHDLTALRDAASVRVASMDALELLESACGQDPILRTAALSGVLERAAKRDASLLTSGVRHLANQERPTLFLFLQDLLTVAFREFRASLDGDLSKDRPGNGVRVPTGSACRAIDRAHRAMAAFSPAEPVLLGMLLAMHDGADDA